VKVVIDHVSGSRRGQRQELVGLDTVSFGLHPGCTESFDAHRDLDASSRHAELAVSEDGGRLVDVGSSNGTYVGGERLVEIAVAPRNRVVVEFGEGGPQVAIWVGLEDEAGPPPLATPRRTPRNVMVAVVLAVLLGLALVLAYQLS